MPTLKKEQLTPEEQCRKDAYELSRDSQRRRRSLFHNQKMKSEVRGQTEAAYLLDSQVGRLSAMNLSNLPRRRLGSLTQGLHYTGNETEYFDFHLCSRDLEMRENAEDLILLDLENDTRRWPLVQATLNIPSEQFIYLLTQDRMYQDLWGEIPNRRRYNLKADKLRRAGRLNRALPKSEIAQTPTRDDLSDAALAVLDGYPATQHRKFVECIEQSGFDLYKMCRRMQRLLLMSGRVETYYFFVHLYDERNVTLKHLHKALDADEIHYAVLSASGSKHKHLGSKADRCRSAEGRLRNKIDKLQACARVYERDRAALAKRRGDNRNPEKLAYLTRKRDGYLDSIATLKEELADLRAAKGPTKARGKVDKLRELDDDHCFERAVQANFEQVKRGTDCEVGQEGEGEGEEGESID